MAYQKILQLSYVDKFLNAIQMEFRNKYKDDLRKGKISRNFDFSETFHSVLKDVETQDKAESKQVKWVIIPFLLSVPTVSLEIKCF